MEEWIGELWHRTITRAASTRHPDQAVALSSLRATLATLFRASGGDAALSIKAGYATPTQQKRSLLQRIAGSETQIERAWQDRESLYFPQAFDWFDDARRNRDAYIWLTLLLACDPGEGDWARRNLYATRQVLEFAPAWRPRYQQLVRAEFARRLPLTRLPARVREAETRLRAGLLHPEGTHEAIALPPELSPPLIWLHPDAPRVAARRPAGEPSESQSDENSTREGARDKKRRGEQAKQAEKRSPVALFFRAESILSWAENIPLDRPDEDDDSGAEKSDDLDAIAVTRDNKTRASRVRFDLDLPAAENDERAIGGESFLPEWDCNAGQLIEHCVRVEEFLPRQPGSAELPVSVARLAKRVRAQLQALKQAPQWQRQLADGDELDLDALLRFRSELGHERCSERRSGRSESDPLLFKARRSQRRDTATLLLADLSRSTEVPVNAQHSVIDVIRETLWVFGEALHGNLDCFALYGFSSLRRDPLRITPIKTFEERYGDSTRARIAALKPGYYTRMGAAIRYATEKLKKRGEQQRVLLLVSDGKPNDLDLYDSRYGIEDTRMAIHEARRAGLTPFCLTIDKEAGQYLPHVFGKHGYTMVRNASELPLRLMELYVQLQR